ncbi:hypothetical protein BH09GEM1_BH09GEM1_01740 [soil metagenome]
MSNGDVGDTSDGDFASFASSFQLLSEQMDVARFVWLIMEGSK